MPRGKAKAKEKAEEPQGPPEGARYGIGAAQEQMAAGRSRWPLLRPKEGERVRMHCLTSGDDENFVGTRFHRFGTGQQTRHYVCLRVLTGGADSCQYCEQGNEDGGSRFALWVFVHHILHPADNTKEDEDAWQEVKVTVAGSARKRTMFREEIKKPKLLRLPAGRQQAWFSQFVNEYTETTDLRLHIYELVREGQGRDDTNYLLNRMKAEPLDADLADSEEVTGLATIEEVLRSDLKVGPTPAGSGAAMGEDDLLGGGGPSIGPEESDGEEEPASEDPEPEDDEGSLI